MKLLLLLVFAAVAVATQKGQITAFKDLFKGKNNERIIGGSPARAGQFPWQVALSAYTNQGSFFCGGSLISDQWVLTAAHCARRVYRFKLQFGILTLNENESGRVEVESRHFVVHPGINNYFNNDVALIKLPEPIQFTDNIRAIKLPRRGEKVGADQPVTVSGWGKTHEHSSSLSPILNFVQLRTIANAECVDIYGRLTIINSTVCCKGASYHNTCQGDSGGPLITIDSNGEATQVGVVSFGHSTGCARGYPSGYGRTESFLDWINQTTGIAV